MLLYLTRWLIQVDPGFNVFGYLTLRAILGALTALAISFVVGPLMINHLLATIFWRIDVWILRPLAGAASVWASGLRASERTQLSWAASICQTTFASGEE